LLHFLRFLRRRRSACRAHSDHSPANAQLMLSRIHPQGSCNFIPTVVSHNPKLPRM
jgi:hypothetical protein